MIQETLLKLGFTDKEALIYMCIFENNKIAPATVARLTKINRATVYSVAKELIKKGVISEDLGNTSAFYTAMPPEEIVAMFERDAKKIDEQKKLALNLVQELAQLPKSQKYSVPKIKFIDDIQLEDYLYKNADKWDASGLSRDKTWWGVQDHAFAETYKVWFEWYWKRLPKEIAVKLITNKKEEDVEFEGKQESRRQIKYWNKTGAITITHAVLGDYIIMVSSQEKPHYMIEIHDAVMAESLRQIFKGIWEDIK